MANSNINTGVNSLLTAAKYVREETLINGNQASQLDSLINAVMELTDHVNEYAAKIADRLAKGLSVERLQRWMESAKAKLTAAVESLREWLKAFKTDRPNVQIDIEDNTTPSNDTTMNEANNAQDYNHAANCLHIYLNNEGAIYTLYTTALINMAAKAIHNNATIKAYGEDAYCEDVAGLIRCNFRTADALDCAARLVQKYDRVTPTPADIETVKAKYVAYIIECAQYQVNNA